MWRRWSTKDCVDEGRHRRMDDESARTRRGRLTFRIIHISAGRFVSCPTCGRIHGNEERTTGKWAATDRPEEKIGSSEPRERENRWGVKKMRAGAGRVGHSGTTVSAPRKCANQGVKWRATRCSHTRSACRPTDLRFVYCSEGPSNKQQQSLSRRLLVRFCLRFGLRSFWIHRCPKKKEEQQCFKLSWYLIRVNRLAASVRRGVLRGRLKDLGRYGEGSSAKLRGIDCKEL